MAAAAKPDFLGIGAQKAGTTWLYMMLRRHPRIRFPVINGAESKELHFWDFNRHLGAHWWCQAFAKTRDDIKIGEITPAYSTLDRAAVEEIRAINPDLTLFFVIRNPIDRAWSGALQVAAMERLDPRVLPDSWFLEQFRSPNNLGRGDYEACLRTWLSVFSVRQLLLLHHDWMIDDPRGFLARVCRHIGVEEAPVLALPMKSLTIRINRSPDLPLRPTLLPALLDLYAPRITRLSRLCNQDLSPWLDFWRRRLGADRQPKI